MYRVTILANHEKENPIVTVNSKEDLNTLLDILFETRYEVLVFKY